jgi:adenine-specific DNA glycosylase
MFQAPAHSRWAYLVVCTQNDLTYDPELLCGDPWKLLVAVMLLNKTAGRVAIPIFWVVVTLWPTSSEMSEGLHASLRARGHD